MRDFHGFSMYISSLKREKSSVNDRVSIATFDFQFVIGKLIFSSINIGIFILVGKVMIDFEMFLIVSSNFGKIPDIPSQQTSLKLLNIPHVPWEKIPFIAISRWISW